MLYWFFPSTFFQIYLQLLAKYVLTKILIIFPLSGSGHPDKYLYEIGHRSQILWSFILKFLAKRTVMFFVEEKVKLSIKYLVTNLD